MRGVDGDPVPHLHPQLRDPAQFYPSMLKCGPWYLVSATAKEQSVQAGVPREQSEKNHTALVRGSGLGSGYQDPVHGERGGAAILGWRGVCSCLIWPSQVASVVGSASFEPEENVFNICIM